MSTTLTVDPPPETSSTCRGLGACRVGGVVEAGKAQAQASAGSVDNVTADPAVRGPGLFLPQLSLLGCQACPHDRPQLVGVWTGHTGTTGFALSGFFSLEESRSRSGCDGVAVVVGRVFFSSALLFPDGGRLLGAAKVPGTCGRHSQHVCAGAAARTSFGRVCCEFAANLLRIGCGSLASSPWAPRPLPMYPCTSVGLSLPRRVP